MKRLAGLALAAVLAASCTTTSPAPRYSGDPSCKLGEEDKVWLAGAPAVWSLVQTDVFQLKPLPTRFTWVLFDRTCIYSGAGDGSWTAGVHNGRIKTPDGETHELGVASFVKPVRDGAFMLMSLPSIWREAGVDERGGMSPFLNSVFAHEMTHLRQIGPIYDRITKVATDAGYNDEDIGDDIVQERFKDNTEFKASVERERDILLAGFAGDDTAARAAAREALDLLHARQARWYTGENAPLAELEDLFLTLEGMGQFAGYSWLVHPDGGARSSVDAVAQMRTRWWSQEEGMAIMLVVSRLVPDWRARAFADKPATALELLALVAGRQ